MPSGQPLRRPVLTATPGPGPAIFAIPIPHERRIALYPRSEDGQTGPVPLWQLPVDRDVMWVEEPPFWRDAWPSEVSWLEGPRLEGEDLTGQVVVHFLVDTEEGTVWSPVVAIRITGRGDTREVDVGETAGGVLQRGGAEWEWSSSDTHVEALCAFLDEQVELLWRVLDGGPGLDAEWRVRALRGASPTYKRWAVDDVLALGDDAVLPLLEILDVVVDRGSAAEGSEDTGPLYALALLAHMGVREAHDRLLALARMGGNSFEEWFGGFLTEQFDAALLRTSGGRLDGIVGLLQDRAADGYLRTGAAEALVGAVALGWADRDEILTVLATQLDSAASVDPTSYVWCGVADAMLELHGTEYRDLLVQACETGLIDPIHFGADYVRERLDSEPGELEPRCLALVRGRDVHEWLGWWACFEDR